MSLRPCSLLKLVMASPEASAMLPLGQRRQLMSLPTSIWSPRPALGEYWPLGQGEQVVAPTPEYSPAALQTKARGGRGLDVDGVP